MVLLDNGGRASGECELFAPPPDLSPLIEHLWIQDGPYHTPTWRVVADTSPHLIAIVTATDRGRQAAAAIVGARSTAADIDVSRRVRTVGLRLRPGTLPILLGLPAHAFTNRSVALASAFHGKHLRDLQIDPDAPSVLLARELNDLVRRAANGRVPPRALPDLAARSTRVAEMATRLRSPSRTLREVALRCIGVGAKRMLRIHRLHAALAAARSSRGTWSAIAQETGYSDQAHLIREMRALLGETPTSWSARGNCGVAMRRRRAADSYKTTAIGTR